MDYNCLYNGAKDWQQRQHNYEAHTKVAQLSSLLNKIKLDIVSNDIFALMDACMFEKVYLMCK